MKFNPLVAGIAGVTTCSLGVGAYLLHKHYSKPVFRVNPNGKSLNEKYPDAKIPEQSLAGRSNNSFWLGKTQKLKDYLITDKNTQKTNTEHPLVKNIIEARLTGQGVQTNLQKNHFDLDSIGGFVLGNPEMSTVLATFCKTKQNATYSDIDNFPDVMRDLCTEN